MTLLTISSMLATVSRLSGYAELTRANPQLVGVHRSWYPSSWP
jgi:hypothetical protein